MIARIWFGVSAAAMVASYLAVKYLPVDLLTAAGWVQIAGLVIIFMLALVSTMVSAMVMIPFMRRQLEEMNVIKPATK